MFKNILFFVLIYVLNLPAFALQIKEAKDNQAVTANVSSKELTRIFVDGDRIQNIRGVQGTYELTKDEKLGAVFIKLSPMFLKRPFDIFVTTELGHTYNLLLTPRDIPAESIELKPLSSALIVAKHWERNSPYVETLIQLIHYMINDIGPAGYAVINFPNIKQKYFHPGLNMQLVTIYRGANLEGETWRLKNSCCKTLYLNMQDFFDHRVRAISLDKKILHCNEETYLYRVINHA